MPNVRCASSPELATVRCALTSNSKARGGIGSELDLDWGCGGRNSPCASLHGYFDTRIIVLAVPDWPASGGRAFPSCATDGSGSGRWWDAVVHIIANETPQNFALLPVCATHTTMHDQSSACLEGRGFILADPPTSLQSFRLQTSSALQNKQYHCFYPTHHDTVHRARTIRYERPSIERKRQNIKNETAIKNWEPSCTFSVSSSRTIHLRRYLYPPHRLYPIFYLCHNPHQNLSEIQNTSFTALTLTIYP
ncbi:hypothetical protein B9Z19DRAFT_467936 [Tuber borchii]|uniref:Uncharacterized protein n=1 Tax=Tuber borchii TaxID=42251 RepID=A0A2T6ZFJ9_TUBBO|nr:hypothetical protein B9Z19DRAFT_467936 [Tuber borchii]